MVFQMLAKTLLDVWIVIYQIDLDDDDATSDKSKKIHKNFIP